MRGIIFSYIVQQWLVPINARSVIQYFLQLQMYHHMIICDSSLNDETLVEIIENSNDQKLYVQRLDCFRGIKKINNALIVLNDPQPGLVANLLNQNGAQKSLTSNTWLIHSKVETNDLSDYFKKNKLRLGINAKIFIAKESGEDVLLYQALGIATISPEIKVNFIKNMSENFGLKALVGL